MALTNAQAEAALKILYPEKKVRVIGYKNNVFLGLVPKDTSFYGKAYDLPIKFGGNTGGAKDFSTAQANKRGGDYGAFLLTRKKDYALGSIETEVVQASMQDIGSFTRLAKQEVDDTIAVAGHMLNINLFRNHGGAIGRISSVDGSGPYAIHLTEPSDVVHFERGHLIVSSNTDGTSGAVDAEAIEIEAIDRDQGILYSSTDWQGNGHFSNDDYLFREGDFGASISGLEDWLPATAPSNTLFFNQDRSLDTTRLGGVRFDASSAGSIEEALLACDVRMQREGAMPTHVIMNTDDHGDFRRSLGSRVVYDKVASPDQASVGYRSIVLTGSQSDVQVVSDRDCPKGVAYMLDMKTWVLATLGPAPKFLTAMGEDETIWEVDADAVEFRIGYYGQLGCKAPGHNARIVLP